MQKISVLLAHPFSCCTYFHEEILPAGTYVRVPFGKSDMIGVVWDTPVDESFPEHKIKSITSVLSCPRLNESARRFIDWVAAYTLSPPGLILKMAMPVDDLEKQSKKPIVFEEPILKPADMVFSASQQKAITELSARLSNGFSVTLIDGVTGSGKTEVYFEAIEKALSVHRQVLVLLPEITLTGAWLKRFEKRFGVKPACWHSDLTPKVRRETWQAVVNGTARVLVGARSALFLPFQQLGLIIVDEEHDASYKQEEGVIYQARDMAVVRGQINQVPVLLASATPSLETYCNVTQGKYGRVVLPERFSEASLPEIQLVDMRTKEKGQTGFLSPALRLAMAQTLEEGSQTLLFLNRRGYAPMRLCKACGEKMKCPHCSVFLTEHHHPPRLMCHQCGYSIHLTDRCPACGEKDCFISCGPGVERIHEEALEIFPQARIEVITSDTISSAKAFESLSERLLGQEIDILIGTQMLAKGHNFPDLTLVGIVDADFGLTGGDLRAAERTFQLLQQVSGRAGRSLKKGRALLQTYSPQNLVIQALAQNDRNVFMQAEIEARSLLNMPPFGRLAAVIISSAQEAVCEKAARALIKRAPFMPGVEFLGPVAAPLYQLRGKYRYRILIKSNKTIHLQKILRTWLASVKMPSIVTVRVDIDPYNFL